MNFDVFIHSLEQTKQSIDLKVVEQETILENMKEEAKKLESMKEQSLHIAQAISNLKAVVEIDYNQEAEKLPEIDPWGEVED